MLGILLCLLRAPHYELLFYVFGIYVLWICLRYVKERQQPVNYLPWYYSKPRVAVFGASLSILCGVVGVLSNTAYTFDFVLAAILLILAVAFRSKRDTNLDPH